MSDDYHTLLALRNQLSDALAAIPSILERIYKPPIIDTSFAGDDSDSESDALAAVPGLRSFEGNIEKEIDSLDKVLNERSSAAASRVSSNAPYFLSVWREINAASSIVSVGQTYSYSGVPSSSSTSPSPIKGVQNKKPPPTSVKVDVTADEGASWIRVNTIKNSRLKAEFNEIDSYSSSSGEDEDENDDVPRAMDSPKWRNNSVIRMATTLLQAARANPIAGTSRLPQVHMRLTRLEPEDELESRILHTIDAVRGMGITVWLGERPPTPPTPSITSKPTFTPTKELNLDLSLLVALVSDITHAPLAPTADDSLARYKPLVRSWKHYSHTDKGLASHSRALGNQAEQERRRALFNDLHAHAAPTAFYASAEARDRLHGILSKIGGPDERRRATALFSSEASAEEQFWEGSRFPVGFLKGLVPIRIHDDEATSKNSEEEEEHPTRSAFFVHLQSTCEILLHEFEIDDAAQGDTKGPETERHVAVKAQPKSSAQARSPALTPHTVRSLLFGAQKGMTTITANKASVRAILREMKKTTDPLASALEGVTLSEAQEIGDSVAAMWVIEPRSLAENMRVGQQEAEAAS